MEVFDPFEVSFCMWYKVRARLHSFTHDYLVFPTSILQVIVFSPLNGLGTLVKKSFDLLFQGLFLGFLLNFIVLRIVFMTIPLSLCHGHTLLITVASQLSFEIRKCKIPNFVLFQNCFGHLGSLESSCKFQDNFLHFCKKCYWEFNEGHITFVSHFV